MNAVSKLSVKGQVVIPKDVRDALRWSEGLELEVLKGADSVTFKPKAKKRKSTGWEKFTATLPMHDGPPIPEEEWADAIGEMFRREWR